MDQETKDRLEQYIETYEQALHRVRFEQVAIALVQEMARDARTGLIQRERRHADAGGSPTQELPATEKQLGFLKRLGVEIPENLSKQEASQLIDEAQAKAAL